LVFTQVSFISKDIYRVSGDIVHIMEGFLPLNWCVFWYILALPVVAYGAHKMNIMIKQNRDILPLLAVAGAFIFVLSSLKMPSVTGSCSHPTGTGIGAILFGPWITAVLSIIVLIFQALFLAHGGITTLGANTFSMGIVGPIVGYLVYKACMKQNLNLYLAVFLAALFADWFTYIVTSIELAVAFPAASGGVLASFEAFLGIFAITQVPLAIVEGAVSALLFKYIVQLRGDVLLKLKVASPSIIKKMQEASP
jgi:cobalt/nickel transport system permease protein